MSAESTAVATRERARSEIDPDFPLLGDGHLRYSVWLTLMYWPVWQCRKLWSGTDKLCLHDNGLAALWRRLEALRLAGLLRVAKLLQATDRRSIHARSTRVRFDARSDASGVAADSFGKHPARRRSGFEAGRQGATIGQVTMVGGSVDAALWHPSGTDRADCVDRLPGRGLRNAFHAVRGPA